MEQGLNPVFTPTLPSPIQGEEKTKSISDKEFKDAGNAAPWRWFDFVRESGQLAMDRDRKLFNALKNGEERPFLRFFAWAEPALSYGRTQGLDAESQSDATSRKLPTVRRPTGGGKVYHNGDLCFSLAWKKEDSNIPWNVTDSYSAIHLWLQKSLETLDIKTQPLREKAPHGNGWCFQSAVCSDLIQDGKKIVGGAQWRDSGTALHQGSIQVRLSPEKIAVFKSRFEHFFKVRFSETD